MNTAAEALLGVSRRSAIDRSLAQIVQLPDTLAQHLSEARRLGNTLIDREIELARRDYPAAIVDCMITPIETLGKNPQPQLLVEIVDNDRQNKIANEQQLLEQQQQSQALLRSLAHEVLNPLGGIRGAAQLMAQETTSQALSEYTDLIIREADRLKNLLGRLLGPNSRPVMAAHNIHPVIDHVTRLLLANTPSVKCVYDYDPSIPDLHCDRERMIQVLINILSNALKAMAKTPQPTIIIRTRVERNFTIRNELIRLVCRIQIIDNGAGVEPAIRETLFYPLVTSSAGGTGLGLSIAQSLVMQHGGLIECQSEPGNTVFTITLPLDQAARSNLQQSRPT